MIALDGLTGAEVDGWELLFALAAERADGWVLVGGQMMLLHAAECAVPAIRATDDIDVVVDIRAVRDGTRWLSQWLASEHGFELASVSPDGIGHRFVRPAPCGAGRLQVDVLAPEHVGDRASLATLGSSRTVQAPGTRQAIARSQLVEVSARSLDDRRRRTGLVRRPNLLGALVAKAAATGIGGRRDAGRDWQDAAFLLSLLADPFATAEECTPKDRQRLRRLRPLHDRSHLGWGNLDDDSARRGSAALSFLVD